MSDKDETERAATGEPRSETVRRAHQAFDAAREFVAGADVDQLRAKATDAAAAMYRDGREFLSDNVEFGRAKDELRGSIRRNPLAAVGIAFAAGLLLALLARG